MGKGASQVGTQTTTSIDPRAQYQAPYLQQGWDYARDLMSNRAPDYSGVQGVANAAQNPTQLNLANQASNPYSAATGGGYSGYNSPAFGGYQNVAGGATSGQNLANQGAYQQAYLSSMAQPYGQAYANLIGQSAAGVPGAVADPMQKLQQQSSGYYLNSNPYLDQMYNTAAGALTRNYQTATAPRTASSFEGAGRYGSPSAQNAVSQNEQNLGSSLGTLAGNIYGQNYAAERGLQNQATTALGQLGLNANQQMMQGYGAAGNMALAGLGQGIGGWGSAGNLGLSGTGQQLAGLSGLQGGYQAGNAAALQGAGMLGQMQAGYMSPSQQYANAIQQMNQMPWDWGKNYMSMITQPSGYQATQSQQPIYGNPGGEALGTALKVAQIGAMFAGSDRRIKEDTKVVGRIGKLPLHTFRYKGDPVKRVGFMADEVEKIDPGAVATTNLGFKAVDYGRAAASALKE
jgi:hypothetical protein